MTEDAHDLVCSRCGGVRDRGPDKPYCRACKNAYDRTWRKLQAEMRKQLEADLLAAAYGKDVPRETVERLEKRARDDA
jgi:hypothetical protein